MNGDKTSQTEEIAIVRQKWWAVIVLIAGGVMLAGRLPIPTPIPFVLFFVGHVAMLRIFLKKHDQPMVIVNFVWILIDILGFIRWL